MVKDYDFRARVTSYNVTCTDGRIIRPGAFADCDGMKVPLVWQHNHADPDKVLGHMVLEDTKNDMIGYGYLNDKTPYGKVTRSLLEHEDVSAVSIYANGLTQRGNEVVHGTIREVSVVLAGANPGAYVDQIIEHDDSGDESAIFTFVFEDKPLMHSAESDDSDELELDDNEDSSSDNSTQSESEKEDTMAHSDEPKGDSTRTVQDVIDTMNEEQKNVYYASLAAVVESVKKGKIKGTGDEESDEEDDVKHNVFEGDTEENTLSHDAMDTILKDGKRFGSLKESFLQHADDYGISNIDYLFPEPHTLDTPPAFIKRDTDWVAGVINGVHHTPFSRIKSQFADITEDEARAKGYIKGKYKKEEVFSLLKRTTNPTTVYKKQKFDRDDLVDITDFDVLAWVKSEMRLMLDEEIARAILIGDGRLSSSDDKIDESCIRPILTDDDLFSVKVSVTVSSDDDESAKAKKAIRQIIKSRKQYKGSGNPTLYTTNDFVVDCLLIEDTTGRRIYNTVQDLATALRVDKIVEVEVMEGVTRTIDSVERPVLGIMVNLKDYNVGADKGGAINMFDDFDIDYNQQKYLIETRCSGALIKPYSALVIDQVTESSATA